MLPRTILILGAITATLCLGQISQHAAAQRIAQVANAGAAVADATPEGVFRFEWHAEGHARDVRQVGFMGLTFLAGDLTRSDSGRTAVETALRVSLVADTIEAFLAERPEVITNAVKESFQGAIDTVTINPKKWPAPKPGQVLVAIRVPDSSREPGDLEIPPGSQYLNLEFRMSKLSWPRPSDNNDPSRELRKFARRLAEKLAQDVPDFSREYLKKRMADGVVEFESRLKQAEANRDAAQKTLTESAGLPREKSAEQLAEVSRQLIDARLALVGMEAREKAITDEIKKTEAKMAGTTESDETLHGLSKLLLLRMEQLDRLKLLRSKNAVAEQEVQTAEAGVLSAKIELDKAKAALKRANGGERLETFNDELSRLAIDRAEAKARFAYLEEATVKLAEELRNREAAEHRIEEARLKLVQATQQIRQLSDQLATVKAAQETIEPIRVILPPDDAEAAGEVKK